MKYPIVLVLLAACVSPTAPGMDAPDVYRTWYSEVEACSGLRGDFDALMLRTANAINVGGVEYSGYWTPPHTITIRLEPAWLNDETLVKHEFMHDLLQSGAHPDAYFRGVCGDLIDV